VLLSDGGSGRGERWSIEGVDRVEGKLEERQGVELVAEAGCLLDDIGRG
jgi:hypothetical protein